VFVITDDEFLSVIILDVSNGGVFVVLLIGEFGGPGKARREFSEGQFGDVFSSEDKV